MTFAPHLDSLREALDTLCAAGAVTLQPGSTADLEALLKQEAAARPWHDQNAQAWADTEVILEPLRESDASWLAIRFAAVRAWVALAAELGVQARRGDMLQLLVEQWPDFLAIWEQQQRQRLEAFRLGRQSASEWSLPE